VVLGLHRTYFFLVLSLTRPKLPLGQILNYATCDVYSPKAVETLMHRQCYEYCFLYCVKNIFSFGSIEVKNAKERYYVSHGMR